MRASSLLYATFLITALHGCGMAPVERKVAAADMSTFDCAGVEACKCEIRVVCPPGGPCEAKVKWDLMRAAGHVVRWHVANQPGQTYALDRTRGIQFKTVEGSNAFRCQSVSNGDYQCEGNRNGNTYEYAIHLVGMPPVPALDPFVVNN
ncbi:MAG: hypothetical protein ABI920_12010 [Casimicrobiaceae bacterium]